MRLFILILITHLLLPIRIFSLEEEFLESQPYYEQIDDRNIECSNLEILKLIFIKHSEFDEVIKKLIIDESKSLNKYQVLKIMELEKRINVIKEFHCFFTIYVTNNSGDPLLKDTKYLESLYNEFESEQYVACCCCCDYKRSALSVFDDIHYALPNSYLINPPSKLQTSTLINIKLFEKINEHLLKGLPLKLADVIIILKEILLNLNDASSLLNEVTLKQLAQKKMIEYKKMKTQSFSYCSIM